MWDLTIFKPDLPNERPCCPIPPGQGLKSGGNASCQHYSIPDERHAIRNRQHRRLQGPRMKSRWGAPIYSGLLDLLVAQAEALCNGQVALVIGLAEIGQHPATMPNQFQQTAAAGLIVPVGTQMLGKLLDAACHDGDLYLGRTSIAFMTVIIGNELGLDFLRERHDVCVLSEFAGLRARSRNHRAGPVTSPHYIRLAEGV